MRAYFIRRLLMMIPTFIGITLVTFVIINLAPGGPVEQFLREIRFGALGNATMESASTLTHQGITEETLAELRTQFGFDRPLIVRYFMWLGNLVRLDFGSSLVYDEPVIEVIVSKFPVSLQFGISSFVLTYLVCIPLGIRKAVRDGSKMDAFSSVLVFLGYAISPLMLGILLIVLLGGGSFLDWFPIAGSQSDLYELLGPWERVRDRAHHAALPLFCYLIGNFATLTLLMKNAYLEEARQAYTITARAKGLSERTVHFRHVLRNALVPIVTGLGGFLGVFFVGNLFIEQIFSLDGMGLLFYNALLARDYPVLLGVLSLVSVVLMLGNLISDILYVLVDPRIDFAN